MTLDLTGNLEPLSPSWWLRRLLTKLTNEAPHFDLLDQYYRGVAPVPVGSNKQVREAYGRLMTMARTNFAELVVDATRERMIPSGFRTGAAGDENGDKVAWDIWQRNALDADCDLVHTPQLGMGVAYAIVGSVDEGIGAPLITPEDPRQVTAELLPGRRRVVAAALKVYRDDAAGLDRAYLYLPGTVYRLGRARSASSTDAVSQPATNWAWQRFEASDQMLSQLGGWEEVDPPVDLPPGIDVPVVPFINKPDAKFHSCAEIEGHLGLLDRINYTILNRVEIATLQAFRQRAVKGVPDRDENGEEINYDDIFAMDPGALWIMPETADLWESGQVDLTPLRSAIRDDAQDLAAVTRTPLYYLTPDAANGSAAGAALSREGLIFKVSDRIRQASQAWEQVMSLAFRFAGDTDRADRAGLEVMWAPPERYSLAERADAGAKAIAGGVPWRTVMADIWQFSPQQIERMEAERMADALVASLAAPAAPPLAQGPALSSSPPPVPVPPATISGQLLNG
jgi:hypothetical protein